MLVLGPALAGQFRLPEAWAGSFLLALGAGTILGSFIPCPPPSRVRHAIWPLFLLGLSVTVFALGFRPWMFLGAAPLAGIACLITGSVARALLWTLIPEDRARPAVMTVWAIAWAGSKPLASLVDGMLATFAGTWAAAVFALKLPSVQVTGVLLALPSLLPGLAVMPRLLRSLGTKTVEV